MPKVKEQNLPNGALKYAIDTYKAVIEAAKNTKDEDYSPVFDELTIKFLEELQQYREIGSLQQCKEAVSRAQEIELMDTKGGNYKGICPVCNNHILGSENYCAWCGQKVGIKNDSKRRNGGQAE